MPFCSKCGQRLEEEARFCSRCGEAVNQNERRDFSERRIRYEGETHKCPNCGEIINSFTAHCPSCGYEIRGVQSSLSVREFSARLDEIESRKMPDSNEKPSWLKRVFGNDFQDEEEVEKARRRFREQKRTEMVNFIINYSVPNTKEDILEFLLLANSNIKGTKGVSHAVTKAWIAKLEQVYQKAEASVENEQDFLQMKALYDDAKKYIKREKYKVITLIIVVLLIAGFCLVPRLTIRIFVCAIVVAVVWKIFRKKDGH